MANMEPVIVSSENGDAAAARAMDLLRADGAALDAVVAAADHVEQDLGDHSVGIGGMPNVRGEVELDASVMEGCTRRAGAVAALRQYADAARLARYVMERTPHVLIVGEGAQQLAREAGCSPVPLEREASLRAWRERFGRSGLELPADDAAPMAPLVNRLTTQLRPSRLSQPPPDGAALSEVETGTVNFLALDARGRMASAVSTSGLGWKYPGRVGDSPIIGAGNYCDGRFGAAACTGLGELCLRALTARTVVEGLRRGCTLHQSARHALRELATLTRAQGQFVSFVALTPDGRHMGYSERGGQRYAYLSASMTRARLAPRLTLAALAAAEDA